MGLAYRIVVFVAALAAFSLMWGLLDGAVADMFALSTNTTTTQNAAEGREYATQMWTFAPFFAIVAGALGLVAGSIFDSRGGR
ncbi:hypothetical protein [Halomarina rubra]|uniref:MFS transporter n=1 Tax=Halomarina rubra TaxID=2071873 RepID=A0ABD6B1E9_9EURY|nr:hypothetical protein [Halomarina rubra]